MTDLLRILLTADPELPVPPVHYGGIERVIALLADGLTVRGHDVTLVAHRDSRVRSRLVKYPLNGSGAWSTLRHAVAITQAAARIRPQVVHSFGRLATLGPLLAWPVPKIMSYQRAVTPRSVTLGRLLAGPHLTIVGCSGKLLDRLPESVPSRVVYNAVDVTRYTFAPAVADDAPLVFLGRIEHIKGTHVAIEVARITGRRLVIAGIVSGDHRAYFERFVRPHLNGPLVSYIGPVDDAEKNRLLSGAAALLMPILWEEPFGIVMAEALACGTPVIGLGRGAVPEVIDHGVTGFVCDDAAGMAAAVRAIDQIDRAACREAAEVRFSQRALVDAYEGLYADLLSGEARRRAADTAAVTGRRD